MTNFSVEAGFLQEASDRWSELRDDQAKFLAVVDRAKALEMPPADSVAGKASEGTDALLASTDSAVRVVQNLLGTISTNLSETSTAYHASETEQLEKTKEIWSELGHPAQFPVRDISDDIAQQNAPIVHRLPSVEADLGREFSTSLRGRDLELAVLNFDVMWRRESHSVVGQILQGISGWSPDHMLEQLKPDIDVLAKISDAFVLLTEGYGQVAVCHARDSRVTMQRWTGASADMAMDYFITIEEWYNAQVVRLFNAVAQHYGVAASDLHGIAKQLGYWLESFTGAFNDLVTAAQAAQAKDLRGVLLACGQGFVDAVKMMGKISTIFLDLMAAAQFCASGIARLTADGVGTVQLSLPSRVR